MGNTCRCYLAARTLTGAICIARDKNADNIIVGIDYQNSESMMDLVYSLRLYDIYYFR